MDKLVSVIVPVYKVEDYLVECIESIRNQTYKNIEIILVDDGSPDKCPDICDAYLEKDMRIKVFHKENGGLSSARNYGIDVATGEYITFVDSDDSINERFVEFLYSMCEDNNCQIAQCDFLMTKEDSIKLCPQRNSKIEICNSIEAVKRSYTGFEVVKYLLAWNKMYHKSLFDDIRFPLGKLHEDVFVSYRLYWKAKKIAITNLYLYYYLQREGSITGQDCNIARIRDSVEALRGKAEFLREKGLIEEYNTMLYSHYFNLRKSIKIVEDNMSGETEVLMELEAEEEVVKSKILNIPQKSFLERIRSIYPLLDEKEQHNYLRLYGERIAYTHKVNYEFPFDRVKKGTKIAIYGAGIVGKEYVKQIRNSGWGEVVLWVDNAWKNYVKEGFGVEPIDALLKCEYDCVVIAVRAQKIANEIKENLLNWGVDENKIIYEMPLDGIGMRNEFLKDTENIGFSIGRRCFLMNSPDHGNVGDHALAIAAISFLKDYFPQNKIIDVTGRQWDACKEKIASNMNDKDIIFVVGGGFMGDLWPVEDTRMKEIVEAFPNNKIIFLPQTFFYELDSEESNLEFDTKLYNEHCNILFLHRERNSYNFFKQNVVKDVERNGCYPDMALYMKNTMKESIRKKVLLCLRLDKEMVGGGTRQKLFDICERLGLEVELIDTVIDKKIGKKERTEEVENLLTRIRNSELFVTDRLHGMLFATITGTPCIAFDNISKKVSGVYKWIECLDYVTCTDEESVDEEMIINYLNKKDNYYERLTFKQEFDDMAVHIKRWVNLD